MRVHCTVRQTLQFDILRFYILKEQYNEIFIIQTSLPEPLANRLKNSSPSYADSSWSGILKYCIFSFFAELFMHATLLIIVRIISNLWCWIVRLLSFLERKKIIYLYNRPFCNCSCILVHFLNKVFALFKNRNVYSNYFMNGKWYFNGFELQSIM